MLRRVLSWLLVLTMVLSLVPTIALAEDSATYTQITSMEELTSGQYVLVVETGYAPTVLDGSWILAEAVTAADGKVTDPAANQVWTLTVDGSTAKLTDSNGVTIAPKGGNNNGILSGDYSWNVTCTDGTFQFAGQGEDTVVLASNKGSENKFRGYKTSTVSGNAAGYPSNFTLYKLEGGAPAEPARTSGLVTDLTTLRDGDTLVVFNPANLKALSTSYNGFYNNGTAVTLTDGVLAGYTDAELWTLGISEDGSYTFSTAEGKKLSMGASYTSTPLDDVNTAWTISDAATEGCFYIKNVARECYLEYQTGYGTWSAYYNITEEALFAQQLYLVVEDTTTEPDPEPTPETLLKDGDQVVIYNPANLKALSTNYSGFYNASTDVTLTDGVLSGYTEADIWTVGVNDDGSYTFSTAEGKKLSMGASYTSTPLDDVNPNWEISDAATEGCYYIKNTARNSYLEYQDTYGTWSAYYNIGTNEALFAQAFYVIPEVREEGIVSELHDGDTVVVFNPANMKALSTNYSGFYNASTDVTLTDGKLTGYTEADIWTVGINEDGSYTFSTAEGKKLSMGASYTSTPLDDVNPNWEISAAATADCFYIKNTARNSYLEYQDTYGTWSAYYNIGTNEALFAQQFYLVVEGSDSDSTLPAAGDQVVIYNVGAEGVLALQDDNAESPSINSAAAAIENGKATCGNGAVVFTVETNDGYYRFYNETYGYLCSNGTGNNAYYTTEASEDADWTLAAYNGGYSMESRTAKYNGIYSQYLEYYGGSYKTYSMYNVTDANIYTFRFYPCANEGLTGGVVNQPDVIFGNNGSAYVGLDYTYTFSVDAVFGVKELTVTCSQLDKTYEYTLADGVYTVVVPAADIDAIVALGQNVMGLTISGTDNQDVPFVNGSAIDIIDEPVISDVTPASGSETGEDLKPVISASVTNAGQQPTVTMTVNGEAVAAVYADGKVTYTPDADLAQGRTSVTVTVTRADGKTAEKSWSFIVGEAQYQLYFGQLHSHTTYSDGAGSLETALAYIASLPESANVDFVAFTDHSNYFDSTSSANPEGALYDMSLASESSQKLWSEYKTAVAEFNATHSNVIAIGGFEMTWSGGPGHINTFNTAGIVSRNNTTLNNKTSDAGMKAYYALLSQVEGVDSISQFNHPGTTFGNFTDFSYYDALIDSRIYLVEVGNGEGQIGAGGYYPSYEQYTMALDKGWHVAPTNNQDNHKGKWGNANDARDVILTDDFSEEGLYEAIRNYRVYATEDKNLEIGYTVNGLQLGSIIEEIPETLNLEVSLYDPDSSDSISKVEVIVNSGKVAYTWDNQAELASGLLTATLEPTYSYYYIRVTEGDGDLAVTAPVWVGETLKLGISSVECGTSTPVTDEEVTITTTLFNSETVDAAIKSLTYTTNGSVVLGTDTTGYALPASGSASVEFQYTPDKAKVMTITVTAVIEQDGVEYTYSMDVELDVQDASKLVYIGIDAAHYNEYVAGNYKDSMGNFGELAAEYSVRTVQLNTSEELIAACANEKYKAIILTAPSRRLAAAQTDPKTYSAEELAAIVEFNNNGGVVILAGWSDNYENYDVIQNNSDILHMAATQNEVLEALGSSLRISDDATYDDVRSAADGVDKWRLYFSDYNYDSFLTDGVEYDAEHPYDRMYTEVFSHYGGASVYAVDSQGNATSELPSTVLPVVYTHASTYSVDVDGDGLGGNIPEYTLTEGDDRLLAVASEQIEGKGLIIVSGAAFMSNFEVQATISDSGSEKNYSNYRICENLVQFLNPVQITPIAEVQAQTETGLKYTIEGVVTSNASGYDKDTAFFDCIYVQDETGGVCCFPVAGNYKVGDLVRITGTTDFYQGEMELQVTSIEVIGEGTAEATTINAGDLSKAETLGKLVTVSGNVAGFKYAEGLVQTILVAGEDGYVARVFIDGYITTDQEIANLALGCEITVTGLASYDNTFKGNPHRIRVRDRADVVCTPAQDDPSSLFTDVESGRYYSDAIDYVVRGGLMIGMEEGYFGINETLTRAQLVTVLYRLEGSQDVSGVTVSFQDLNAESYYMPAVIWAADTGLVLGRSAEVFDPDAPVTRQELVTILYRYCGYKGYDQTITATLEGFEDAAQVNRYAREPMQWALTNGIVKGTTVTTLSPRDPATRAHAATIFYRLAKMISAK